MCCCVPESGSNGVVIEELSDETRKKSSVVIKELPDEPLKIARARTNKKEIGIVIRDLDGKDDTLTQASNAPVHDPKDKGKQKVGVEQTTDSKLCEYFDSDEDYLPMFDGDDYDQYGIDDDWLGDMEGKFNESSEWIRAITQGSTGTGFFSEEDMLVRSMKTYTGMLIQMRKL
ncbi:hypothetical protein M0R45_035638 [Rubus argutus]|uniref:Uncharacterized protein n=1 Tax=Rubus argutus TaxID=59490 RepID=A0AAW1VUV1_RUBAR